MRSASAEKIESCRPGAVPRVAGRLRVAFQREAASGTTVLARCEQQAPLRAVRAFANADRGALLHLHNLSGGVLGADWLEIFVEVGPGAVVQLTTTGATRVYRSRKGLPDAVQLAEINVGENALLEYVPDPVIPFAGSRYRQQTRIRLAPGAGLFWWEAVAPGREARNELFRYERFEMRNEIFSLGRAIALENVRLEPHQRPLDSALRLGRYRYFGTFYACRAGEAPATWLSLEKQLAEMAAQRSFGNQALWGVSALPADGLVVRGLAESGREMTAGLIEFWRFAKLRLYGREAVLPRKVA